MSVTEAGSASCHLSTMWPALTTGCSTNKPSNVATKQHPHPDKKIFISIDSMNADCDWIFQHPQTPCLLVMGNNKPSLLLRVRVLQTAQQPSLIIYAAEAAAQL